MRTSPSTNNALVLQHNPRIFAIFLGNALLEGTKFLKPYDPPATESRIYKQWEESGLFNPDECVKQGVTKADAPTYSIVLPPPNVTGRLHMGHALMLAVEDVFVRYKRMRGFRTLWLPGTDHAAIATQSVVEKQIKKDEGKSRHDLGREELLKRIERIRRRKPRHHSQPIKDDGRFA